MNTAENVLTYVRTQLARECPNIDVDTMLFGEGFLDSTAMLELILWIGDKFNFSIQNEDLTPENFASVRNIVEFIERNTSAQPRGEYRDPVAAGED